jgi:hypothetical protein
MSQRSRGLGYEFNEKEKNRSFELNQSSINRMLNAGRR